MHIDNERNFDTGFLPPVCESDNYLLLLLILSFITYFLKKQRKGNKSWQNHSQRDRRTTFRTWHSNAKVLNFKTKQRKLFPRGIIICAFSRFFLSFSSFFLYMPGCMLGVQALFTSMTRKVACQYPFFDFRLIATCVPFLNNNLPGVCCNLCSECNVGKV